MRCAVVYYRSYNLSTLEKKKVTAKDRSVILSEDEILEGDTVRVIGKKALLEKLKEMDFF